MNYFMIPGNPPAAHFYELWGNEIRTIHSKATAIVSHYPDIDRSTNSILTMKVIQDYHLDQLRAFHSKTRDKITIIGHSLGAFFALGLLEKTPDLIQKVIFLHPFIRKPHLLGRCILEAVGTLYNYQSVQTALLKSRKHLELFNSDLPHVSNDEIRRSFHLARHEKATIARDQSPVKIPEAIRNKITVYYGVNDIWCTQEVISQLKQQVNVFECDEPHGFITRETHRQNLFNRIILKR